MNGRAPELVMAPHASRPPAMSSPGAPPTRGICPSPFKYPKANALRQAARMPFDGGAPWRSSADNAASSAHANRESSVRPNIRAISQPIDLHEIAYSNPMSNLGTLSTDVDISH